MKLFVNGDSHTEGSELYFAKQDAYPYKLAELLNAEIIDNPAIGGAGNDRIERTTTEFLNRCQGDYPDLIVIGWSEFTRTDWFYNGKFTTYRSNDIPPDVAKEIDPLRYTYEDENINTDEARPILARYFQSRIYNFHCYLEHLNIPHLFFMGVNGLGDFIHDEDGGVHQFDWNNCFWNPYEPRPNNSFLSWGVGKGYKKTRWWHLPEEAHEEFAKVLYDHIIKYNIVGS